MAMPEKIKEAVKMSPGVLLQLGSILAVTVLSFALVKAQADQNKSDIRKHEYKFEKNETAHAAMTAEQTATRLLVSEYKGDIKSLASIMNEVKYEVRENRAEMKRWEYEREDKNAEEAY
jgi:Ni/Co efflux regulator RcnB